SCVLFAVIDSVSLHDALPILYWTLDGTSFRWLAKVEHADRSTMSMIQQRIAAHIPRALVRRPVVSIEASRDGWLSGDALLVHRQDRKSTRLNSSHVSTSYSVF